MQNTTVKSPQSVIDTYPATDAMLTTVHETRHALLSILTHQSDKLVVVIGPCSLNDTNAAIDYATRLKKCINQYDDTLLIIMRAYVEKPRTLTGWKGFINDPSLNHSFDINTGLLLTREVFGEINRIGVPIGCEIVNPMLSAYFLDLLSWTVIGARTTESQMHREFASSAPMPVGFKNTTDGNIQVAIDAIQTAMHDHHYLTVDNEGKLSIAHSKGNPYCHLILRGSRNASNYDKTNVNHARLQLRMHGLPMNIMIDCSHGNSQKNHRNQLSIINALCERIVTQDCAPFGVMVESNLVEGKQAFVSQNLTYGQSITDACIGWEDTERVLQQLHKAILQSRARQSSHSLFNTDKIL